MLFIISQSGNAVSKIILFILSLIPNPLNIDYGSLF
jgi:hypothetical protein